MNLFLSAAAALTLALAGVGLLRILWPTICQVPPTARLALGFCVGSFLETAVCFVAFLLGALFSRWLVLAPIIVFGVAGAVTMTACKWSRPQFSLPTLLMLLLVLLALALSWGRPVYGYDALSMWALRAKVAYVAKTWPPTLFDPHTTSHPDYPPLLPCAQAFVFFWINRFDDVASRVIFAAFFAAGAAILWWWLGVLRVGARGVWLLWWCAVPALMEQVKITYADLPLAVFLVVFYGAVVSWLREPRHECRGWLRLAAIFGGLAFWVKQDALIGIGGGFLALLLVTGRRKLPLRPVLLSVVAAVVLALPWHLLVWGKQLPTDFGFPATHFGLRACLVAKEFFKFAFIDGNYAFFWPLFVVTLVFCARRLHMAENLWLVVSIVIDTVAVFAVYLCSAVDLEALLKTSMDRVLVNLFVPALLLVSLLWRGSFAMLRRLRWQRWGAVGVILLVVGMFWVGLHRRSDEELFGITISPFPLALSWVWLIVAVVTVARFSPKLRRGGIRLVWRAAQSAIVMATFGLAVVSVGVFAREAGELRRRFGGKTLAEQHAMVLDPLVKERLAAARKQFPVGTHVRVFPKRSLRYHEFYYAAFPDLIVDDSAEQAVNLSSPP
ncbi:MAG: hypothetical protein ABSH21_00995 [Verrucomicrobiia bacterium]|jgi:hypothetical protein